MGRPKKETPADNSIDEIEPEDIVVDGTYYKGNENLLRGNSLFKWTPQMKDELKLCAKSVLHFAENYFYIITEEGKEKISLYKYQKSLLKAFKGNRFNVVLSSRQSGKCLTDNTLIKIKNKKTGLIEEITIKEFYNRFNKKID